MPLIRLSQIHYTICTQVDYTTVTDYVPQARGKVMQVWCGIIYIYPLSVSCTDHIQETSDMVLICAVCKQGKAVPVQTMKVYRRMDVILTSAIGEGESQLHNLTTLPHEQPLWIEGWVGPRAGLDVMAKR